MTVIEASSLQDVASMAALNSREKGNNAQYIMEKKSTVAGHSVRLLQAFAACAKQRSFARAARELGLSPSAVTKSVRRLEEQMKLRLFQRTTRRVSLTQEGEELYARSRRVLEELEGLALLAAGSAGAPAGVLRLDLPVTYGKKVVLPVLAQLVREHPQLGLEIRLSDQFADVIGSGVDAVVRIGEVADTRLVARRIDRQQLAVYGAPGYFARRRRPRRPADLASHECILFQMPTSGRRRPWEFRAKGKRLSMHPAPAHVVNDGEGMVSAACAGLGLIQIPDLIAAEAVAVGALEEVLAGYRPAPMPISVVFPTHRHMPPRLRLFIDAMVDRVN
jgi:DNA-binding transcriptional LysR family regulator